MSSWFSGLVDGSRSLGVGSRVFSSVVEHVSEEAVEDDVVHGDLVGSWAEGNDTRGDACGTTASALTPAENDKEHSNQA